jgi:hypothetical protein
MKFRQFGEANGARLVEVDTANTTSGLDMSAVS